MSESVTFNFVNPTNEEVNAQIFESPQVLASQGVSQSAGSLVGQITVNDFTGNIDTNFQISDVVFVPYINAFLLIGPDDTFLPFSLTLKWFYLDNGTFSDKVGLGLGSTLESSFTIIPNAEDIDGNIGQAVFFSVFSAGLKQQVIIRFQGATNPNNPPAVEFIGNLNFAPAIVTGAGARESLPNFIYRIDPTTGLDVAYAIVGGPPNQYDLGGVSQVNQPLGAGLRINSLELLGLAAGERPTQFKYDGVNDRIIMVTTDATRALIIRTFIIPAVPLFTYGNGSGGIVVTEGLDVLYVEKQQEYYFYYTDNIECILAIFDAETLTLKTSILGPLNNTTPLAKATMAYDFTNNRVLFKSFPSQTGIPNLTFFDPVTRSVVGTNSLVAIFATTFDYNYDGFFPSNNTLNRIDGNDGDFLSIINLKTFESIEFDRGDLGANDLTPTGVQPFLQANVFNLDQNNYVPTISDTTSIPVLSIFAGQATLGNSPISVDTEAGGQSYEDVVDQIQNQDYVISDLYIRTFTVEQANKTVTVNWLNANGFEYNEEHFPTIDPMQPQLVIKDLPFKFTANSMNNISYPILPNQRVEFILTYEEFGRSNTGQILPDVDKLNKLLGVGEYAEEDGIELIQPKRKKVIFITRNPFTDIIYKK